MATGVQVPVPVDQSEAVEREILFVKRDPSVPHSQLVDQPTGKAGHHTESRVEAIVLCKRKTAYMLVFVEQDRGNWTVSQIKTDAFDFEDDDEMAKANEAMCGLRGDDFFDFTPKIREYTHLPSQADLWEFMAFSEWSKLPACQRIVWEGAQDLPSEP